MKVIRASRAGFCMGVSLALKKLEKALQDKASTHARICTLGPIIHNPQVLEKFARLGVFCLEDTHDAREDDFVLIRAHGITRGEESKLRSICTAVEDATCPKVKKAQIAIAEATAAGASLLLFGDAAHPEVRGLISYAAKDAQVFGSPEELAALKLDPKAHWVLASQTTQDREIFEELAAKLKNELPHLLILSTICDATRERQEEAIKLAREVDVMVVAGGKESGNTRRLAELARQAGIETFHVETAAALNEGDFREKSIVGLTAGASTPKSIIDDIEKWLENI